MSELNVKAPYLKTLLSEIINTLIDLVSFHGVSSSCNYKHTNWHREDEPYYDTDFLYLVPFKN